MYFGGGRLGINIKLKFKKVKALQFICDINKVLLVADGLDFEFSGFGLSEFITTINKLEQSSLLNVKYKVTVAQRKASMPTNPNPVIVNRLNNFRFYTSVNLNEFDQV
jgi:hypothetical protein